MEFETVEQNSPTASLSNINSPTQSCIHPAPKNRDNSNPTQSFIPREQNIRDNNTPAQSFLSQEQNIRDNNTQTQSFIPQDQNIRDNNTPTQSFIPHERNKRDDNILQEPILTDNNTLTNYVIPQVQNMRNSNNLAHSLRPTNMQANKVEDDQILDRNVFKQEFSRDQYWHADQRKDSLHYGDAADDYGQHSHHFGQQNSNSRALNIEQNVEQLGSVGNADARALPLTNNVPHNIYPNMQVEAAGGFDPSYRREFQADQIHDPRVPVQQTPFYDGRGQSYNYAQQGYYQDNNYGQPVPNYKNYDFIAPTRYRQKDYIPDLSHRRHEPGYYSQKGRMYLYRNLDS